MHRIVNLIFSFIFEIKNTYLLNETFTVGNFIELHCANAPMDDFKRLSSSFATIDSSH